MDEREKLIRILKEIPQGLKIEETAEHLLRMGVSVPMFGFKTTEEIVETIGFSFITNEEKTDENIAVFLRNALVDGLREMPPEFLRIEKLDNMAPQKSEDDFFEAFEPLLGRSDPETRMRRYEYRVRFKILVPKENLKKLEEKNDR